MAKDKSLKNLSMFAGNTLTAMKGQGVKKPNYSSEQISALKDIAAIPGAIDTLQANPDMMAQVLADPAGALQTYNDAVASGGGTGASSPSATVTVDDPITPPPLHVPSDVGLPTPDVSVADTAFNAATGSLDAMIKQLSEVNQSFLKGELPGDVTAAVRQGSAQSALTAGLYGPSAVQLNAGNLGLTSLNMITQGVAQGAQIAQLQTGLADLTRMRREFDYSYLQNNQQLMEDMRRTDLNAMQLEEQRKEFNASSNLQLISYISTLMSNSAQVQTNLAINDVDGATIAADFNSLISSIDALIKKSNPV